MFFRVVESSRVDGKNRVTVEYDGPSFVDLLHFFETAAEFAHQFRYKADTSLKSQEHVKEWAATEQDRKAHHAHILSLWRSMKGVKPTEKVHRIQVTMKAQGREYRSCDVYAIISIAIDDERKSKACSKGGNVLTVEKRPVQLEPSSSRSDPRVRLVSPGERAHRREADPEEYSRRHDDINHRTLPSLREERFGCTDQHRGAVREGARTGGQ